MTWLFGEVDPVVFESAWPLVLQKEKPLFGYGISGYLWFRAFSATFPNGPRIIWAGLAIACTFLIASLDEWHQSFPRRARAISEMWCSIPLARSCLYPWPWLPSGGIASARVLSLELIGASAVMGT